MAADWKSSYDDDDDLAVFYTWTHYDESSDGPRGRVTPKTGDDQNPRAAALWLHLLPILNGAEFSVQVSTYLVTL